MKSALYIVCFLVMGFFVMPSAASAAALEDGASSFVNKLGTDTIGVLSKEGLTVDDRAKQFEKIFVTYFDVKTIARFVLGKHWATATKAQQDEYMKLFKSMVVKIYSERFNEYTNEKLEVKNAVAKDKRDVFVASQIVFEGSRPPIAIEWRVRKKEEGYKVIDVSIEGVSMSVTQRSDFSSIIESNGGDVEALLAQLRTKYGK